MHSSPAKLRRFMKGAQDGTVRVVDLATKPRYVGVSDGICFWTECRMQPDAFVLRDRFGGAACVPIIHLKLRGCVV